MSPNVHTEARGCTPRPPCTNGVEGGVGPCLDKREGKVVSWYTKEEGGEPQAMKRGEGAACCLDGGSERAPELLT